MIGFYDPATLKIDGDAAVIDFINATDMDDRKKVRAAGREEIEDLAHNLRHQRDNKISALGGQAMTIRGPITMNPGRDDEGVVMIEGDETRVMPVKFAFEHGDDEIPERSLIGAIGHVKEGALIAERAVICPLFPMPRHTSTPR